MHDLIHYSHHAIEWVGVVPFCDYNNDQIMVDQIRQHCPVYFFGESGIREAIRNGNPDVVLSWGDPDLSSVSDRPIIWCAHGSGGFDRHSYTVCRPYATHFAAVSSACLRVFDYEDQKKVKIIYNGIDPERLKITEPSGVIRGRLGLEPNDFVVGYVGRVVRDKNILCLANAIAKLPPRFKLCLVGGGCGYDQFKKELKSVLQSRVVFTGRVTDIANYFQIFDCFVLPSLAEGFSFSFLEAALCKIPCLLTNVGSLPELTEKYGKLWFLLNVPPTYDEIAQSLVTLSKTPKTQLKLLTNAAYEVVRNNFLATHMAHRWIEFIYSVVERRNERQKDQ